MANYFNLRKFLGKAIMLFCVLLFALPSQGQQNKRDSLTFRLKRLETANKFNPKDTTHINLLADLAHVYRFINNDSLKNISQRALKFSKAIGFVHGEIKALENIGNYYSDEGDREKSKFIFKKALKLCKETQDKKSELNLINGLAHDYSYEGNYAQALNLFLQGIDVAKQIDNKHMLSILNESIANLYADQKDFKNALSFYDTVIAINKQLGNDKIHAETQSNMAYLYKEAKNFDYAMFNVNKSIITFEKHKIYDWLAYAYAVKGDVYLEQKKYQWALYWYDQSDMLHRQHLDDERAKIQLLKGMAKVYLGLGRDSLALQYANEGLQLSQKIKTLQGQIECAETLYELHKNNENHSVALNYLEIFKKLSDSLSLDKNRQSLSLLEAKIGYEQEKKELIASNKTALAKQRNYIYFTVIILLILAVVTFLIRRSENIQKKLNKELHEKSEVVSERESELHEINRTKTKLFSIIAHDLRGPIGALQGMLKLFTDGEIGKDEFISFIPKLKADVEHISFSLNNLLSWGQTQLNGVTTKPRRTSIDKIISGNVKLLSELAASKSIKIITQEFNESQLIWADQNQIDIAVRNLLSNAIKFTPENGLITIELEEKRDVFQVMIRDTGIGMNKDIQKKIFTDTTNITTYGTNNEKGTGLGLSLCKEMIQMNKGEIWVESALRKGSTFFFTVPKAEKRYQKAG
ncbi:ATP-binding protein [Flagellimonas eckloniae]|nr:ATP-binding protein [Allomuricauda eckloniae]